MESIPRNVVREIVSLLNQRGFVLDSDVESFCRYVLFDEIVSENIENLRENGYEGGALKRWTTSFKGPSPAYGVYDSESDWTDEDLIEYCQLLDMGLSDNDLTIGKLNRFNLGVEFYCHQCSHKSVVSPDILTKFKPSEYSDIKGRCSECSEKSISPVGLSLFHKVA